MDEETNERQIGRQIDGRIRQEDRQEGRKTVAVAKGKKTDRKAETVA